ncbi:MAG TPA: tyrosine-type recombinase/integrase [Pirellulales bacterium]|nr:tyrosine-type recombinase/integrase [Pirellulales bacterium]HVB82224.1 tyrosine-type recombinase/integrase [Candidatus Binataceae bacterium]
MKLSPDDNGNMLPVPGQLFVGRGAVPALFLDAGEHSWRRFVEFFSANIRNRNTREAYLRAVLRFSRWCEGKKLRLGQLSPFIIAAYIEEVSGELSRPSVKQHLAAIRMLFDYLVIGQVIPVNPAAAVRGPKYSIKKGKTPVLAGDQARRLLDSIETNTVAGLRDRALIGAMIFSFARVSAVLGMKVEDYYADGKRWWIRLLEKGGKSHEVPAHHKAQEFLDEYLAATGIGADRRSPLFRSIDRRRRLSERRMQRRDVLAMVKRRARQAGLPDMISCHTFRATGITAYLDNGGTLENDQPYYLHCRWLFSLVIA